MSIRQPGTLSLVNNVSSNYGGSVFVDTNTKIALYQYSKRDNFLGFYCRENNAKRGGAVYVDDEANTDACLGSAECFIQSLNLEQLGRRTQTGPRESLVMVNFSNNSATDSGDAIYGGLLHQCTLNPFTEEVNENTRLLKNEIDLIRNRADIKLSNVASLPVQIHFYDTQPIEYICTDDRIVCQISVEKGKSFKVRVNVSTESGLPVEANVSSSFYLSNGSFGEGQQIQFVGKGCSDYLNFTTTSPDKVVRIKLYPEGPCGNSNSSTIEMKIIYENCTIM